jgi:hypothetical protein
MTQRNPAGAERKITFGGPGVSRGRDKVAGDPRKGGGMITVGNLTLSVATAGRTYRWPGLVDSGALSIAGKAASS